MLVVVASTASSPGDSANVNAGSLPHYSPGCALSLLAHHHHHHHLTTTPKYLKCGQICKSMCCFQQRNNSLHGRRRHRRTCEKHNIGVGGWCIGGGRGVQMNHVICRRIRGLDQASYPQVCNSAKSRRKKSNIEHIFSQRISGTSRPGRWQTLITLVALASSVLQSIGGNEAEMKLHFLELKNAFRFWS